MDYETRQYLKRQIDICVRARLRSRWMYDKRCAGCGVPHDTFNKGCLVCKQRKQARINKRGGRR